MDNLKRHFTQIAQLNGVTQELKSKMKELELKKDVYKPMWRAKSVTNVAEEIQEENEIKGKNV